MPCPSGAYERHYVAISVNFPNDFGKKWRSALGGPGSGRWYRWHTKDTVEGCRRLDVRDWQRRGLLRPGTWFSWSWWNGDSVQVASINVQVQQTRVLLLYRVRRQGEDWQDIEEPVPVAWTVCRYGGERSWFICPGVVLNRICRRRVAILYGAGRYFLCRHCYNLVYASQREDHATRLISRAQKIRRRLGGSASLMEPFPEKPKGMYWRTYERLWWQGKEAEVNGLTRSLAQLHRMLARSALTIPQQKD